MNIKQFSGIQTPASHTEKVVSALGAAISIALIYLISHWATDFQGAMVILPSMGASAVLIFAVPHGTLSQPWPLFGGNIISAVVGVTCAMHIGNIYLAAGLAVGLSIACMHMARCIHPPGGATALAAVIGGSSVAQLGYQYALLPTGLNCFVIFIVAMIFNNLFAWRRYPSSLMKYEKAMDNPETKGIFTRHIQQAMETLDEVVDIAPEQIKYIVDKADEIMRKELVADFQLEVGAFYTNGKPGLGWSVRQVIDTRPHEEPSKYLVIYRTVDGANKGQSDSITLIEFSQWASEKIKPVKK